MSIKQHIKDRLVRMGPKSLLVRSALALHARKKGFRVRFDDSRDAVLIRSDNRTLVMRQNDFTLVPILIEEFDNTFAAMAPPAGGGAHVLDCSKPGLRRYKRDGLEIFSPGLPEDDSISAYCHRYTPRAGDIVFDVGAHAGLTTYYFSRMVGPTGTVHAFEPDGIARDTLLQNIELHALRNVVVHAEAISDTTGQASFNADGSMGAGLVEHVIYAETGRRTIVETVTLEEFCRRIGRPPDFVKMDIEGAELAVVKSSLNFLRTQPIHLSFDSYHRLRDGSFSFTMLETMLRSIGYEVESSAEFGQMFTWATPAPHD